MAGSSFQKKLLWELSQIVFLRLRCTVSITQRNRRFPRPAISFLGLPGRWISQTAAGAFPCFSHVLLRGSVGFWTEAC
jgi:hypothetical protein